MIQGEQFNSVNLPNYVPDWEGLAHAIDEDPFMTAAVELAKASGVIPAYCVSIVRERPLNRNEAINSGLLVRAVKLMRALVRDTCRDGGDLHLALSRMLIETVVNLKYLCSDDTGDRHTAYVLDSLVSEREFLAVIRRNIQDNGGNSLPIEERMLDSIDDAANAAGIRMTSVPARNKNDWPTAFQRVNETLGPAAYLAFRAGSDALHGGWYDLYRNRLIPIQGVVAV